MASESIRRRRRHDRAARNVIVAATAIRLPDFPHRLIQVDDADRICRMKSSYWSLVIPPSRYMSIA